MPTDKIEPVDPDEFRPTVPTKSIELPIIKRDSLDPYLHAFVQLMRAAAMAGHMASLSYRVPKPLQDWFLSLARACEVFENEVLCWETEPRIEEFEAKVQEMLRNVFKESQ